MLAAYVSLLGRGSVYGLSAERKDGVYTGKVAANHASLEGKKSAVTEIADGRRAFLAIGDSESDIPLFENARTRVIFGNSELLPADEDTWHLDPSESPAQVTEFLSDLIHGRSRIQAVTAADIARYPLVWQQISPAIHNYSADAPSSLPPLEGPGLDTAGSGGK